LHISNIVFQDYNVKFVSNPRLKNSYIQIDKDNCIIVKTPFQSEKFVLELLHEKEAWIASQIAKNAKREQFSIVLGKEILLFGEIYSLESEMVKSLQKRLMRLKKPTEENIKNAYEIFYREFAAHYLDAELQKYAAIMQLSYKELKLRKMRRRWGSCSSKGVITFNTALMKVPKECITYVVIHELAHLVYMNHSQNFHQLVEHYLPDAKSIRQRLRNLRILY